MYKYKQDQVVNFKMSVGANSSIDGKGLVIGVVNTGTAVLGASYIIKPIEIYGDVKFPNEQYPFECLAVSELFLTPEPLIKND